MNILLLPLLNYKIKKFKSYNLFDKKEYSDIAKIIINKTFVSITETILKILEYNIQVKDFLSIFMICENPMVINFSLEDIDESSQEYILYNLCQTIRKLLYKLINTDNLNYFRFLVTHLNNYINRYKLLFNSWKREDRKVMIECLIVSYFELEDFEKDLKGSLIEETTQRNIDIEKEKIIKRLEGLDGIDIFEKVKSERSEFMKDLESKIKDNVYKAYWDSINSKLDNDPPEYLVLIPMLEEILNYINKLTPNNRSILNEAINTFDIPYIEHKIKNNVMDASDVRDIMVYTISIIKKLQSASEDKDTNEWEQSLLNSLMSEPLNKILINFFQNCFERFERILSEATAVRNSDLFDQIKEIKGSNN